MTKILCLLNLLGPSVPSFEKLSFSKTPAKWVQQGSPILFIWPFSVQSASSPSTVPQGGIWWHPLSLGCSLPNPASLLIFSPSNLGTAAPWLQTSKLPCRIQNWTQFCTEMPLPLWQYSWIKSIFIGLTTAQLRCLTLTGVLIEMKEIFMSRESLQHWREYL